MTSNHTKEQALISLPLVVGFCILLILLHSGSWMISVIEVILCVWAVLDASQAIKALSLMVIIKCMNPVLITFPAEFGIVSWVLLIVAGVRLFVSASTRSWAWIIPSIVFTVVVALLTLLQENHNSEVSVMKLIIYTYGSCALIIGFASLNHENINGLSIWFFSLLTAIILLSLPTLAFPSISYARNGTGFQGIMSHPQTFGPMLAPVASWLVANVLLTRQGKLAISLVSLIILLSLMIRSEARTSIVAVILSFAFTLMIVLIRSRKFASFRLGRFLVLSIVVTLVFSIGLLASQTFRSKLTGYVYKHQTKTLDQALASRSGGIRSQWNFFKQSPWVGHGFGVYPLGEFPSDVVKVMGIPISAPVEKGFLPTALLEETGLIGAAFFLYLIVSLGRKVVRNGDLRWIAAFFACLFVNLGEMLFFSLGGIGLYFWLWLCLALRAGESIESSQFLTAEKLPLPTTGIHDKFLNILR